MVNKSFNIDLVGKILKIDFGKTYLRENGLIHYAICISEYKEKYCVIPMTTSNDEIKAAYHPEFRPTGEKRLYLLKKSEGNSKDAALYINDLKFISAGRIIEVGNKISQKAYNDIINLSCEVCFNSIYVLLTQKSNIIDSLNSEVKNLEEKCSILEKNNEVLLNLLNNANKKL